MKLKLGPYRNNIDFIKFLLDTHSNKDDLSHMVSIISLSTGIPIICACVFVKEIKGSNDQLDNTYTNLLNFYSIEGVEE